MATSRNKRRNGTGLPGVNDLLRTIEANFKVLASMMPGSSGATAKPRRRKRPSTAAKAKRTVKSAAKRTGKKLASATRRAAGRKSPARKTTTKRRASRRRADLRPAATMPI